MGNNKNSIKNPQKLTLSTTSADNFCASAILPLNTTFFDNTQDKIGKSPDNTQDKIDLAIEKNCFGELIFYLSIRIQKSSSAIRPSVFSIIIKGS